MEYVASRNTIYEKVVYQVVEFTLPQFQRSKVRCQVAGRALVSLHTREVKEVLD